MLPQGSKACAEPSAPGRATNVLARKLHWHQRRSILHSAGLGWLGLGSLRCAPKMGWIWLDLLYLCYLCAWKYVLIDVIFFLVHFFGIESTEHLSVLIFSSWRVHHQQTGAELSRGNIFDVLLLCSTYVLYLDRKDAVFTEVDGNAGISKIQPKNI